MARGSETLSAVADNGISKLLSEDVLRDIAVGAKILRGL
jgi:hypothetical protein